MSSWVSLHTHTDYSLLDGAARIDDLVKQAVEFDMRAVAITDHGNMYGAIPFYKACRKAGIKPIIGCELYVAARSRFDKEAEDRENYHLTVLAKDNEGYRNLLKLVTAAQLEGFYYKPRVDHDLLEKYNKGLIVLSGCLGGELAGGICRGEKNPNEVYDFYNQVFGDRYYLEIQDHGIEDQATLNQTLTLFDRPRVATNDLHYVHADDAAWHDVMLCMQTQKKVTDESRFRFSGEEFYLKPHLVLPEDALRRTLDIADECNVEIDLGHYTLPPFEIPAGFGQSAYEYLRHIVYQRFGPNSVWPELYQQRVEEELEVIRQTHYETYFLIVWDIYRFAKEQGILAGPGRGSAAGSLVAYCLGITDVDPMRYGLMFERFLNKDRVSMPDVDCDFSVNGREKIINYVREKYGNVAQIITFNTLQSKAAIRDVGRVLDVPLKETDRLAKMIPVQYGRNRSIKECRETIPEFVTDGPLLDLAEKLEGITKGIGTHAAGVVIAPDDITNYTPLQLSPDKTTVISQYDMNSLADIGLLKMDFLGLENLDIIETCIKLIGHDVEFKEDDSDTYELISQGLTTGVFQLGSDGMRGMLKELKPSEFNDIVVANALWRPGPMQYLGNYIRRKHGREEVEYIHPKLEEVLKDTYGLIVFQEQTMKAAQVLAGFTLSEADTLRAAMGKKDREKMKSLKEKFISGCVKNDISAEIANEIFDQIDHFSDYAFNRAHATAYAITGYRTAYLKANYPVQYMCALLTHAKDLEEIAEIARDCRTMGIEILPPDINKSKVHFTIEGVRIRYGLAKIKNMGEQMAEIIVANQPYITRQDFCHKLKDYKEINIKAISAIVNAGGLDEFMERNLALYNLDGIFNGAKDYPPYKVAGEFPTMTEEERMRREREYLGVYLSSHPVDKIKSLDDPISEMSEGSSIITAYIAGIKKIETKNKKRMAYLQLEDKTGSCEAVVFPNVYEKAYRHLEVGRILRLSGNVEKSLDGERIQLLVRNLEAV